MSGGVYRFSLGALECWAISDGTWVYPARAFFANAPEDELRAVLQAHSLPDQLVTPFNCLLINTGHNRVLIDAGFGRRPSAGKLLAHLQAAGFAPGDVDTVILTHGHSDHIGGIATARRQPVFPNARYVLSLAEWEYWNSDASAARMGEAAAKAARQKLRDVWDQLELVQDDALLLPGLWAMSAPGHTPGSLMISAASGGERLIYCSDVVAHPLHLEHPDWTIISDFSPEQAVAARRDFLEKVTDEPVWVFAYHFPFPGLGRITRKDGSCQWQAQS